ncbi:uncharacterized protein LOC120683090 [Panicum virgatum]|uniref:Uncharacterized protein n=1 Tax=Panicum virgatum TaxID=38727 RepID=A0A8T0PSY3_PANVG|nr:uncharacterized protein LOC120683090 [Panicum virgatum]KAG2565521.1 hypothetical protein PVAP13_7NG135817 [Panicum virgatum]
MARRLLVVVVVALALWCGGIESKAPAPKKPKGGGGGGEITVTITIKWKRNYKVSCKDKGGPDCYVGCPKECPNKCIASCTRCRSFCMCDFFPGTSCGDPRFTGGDGNTFYFHGHKDRSFCILSDAGVHINAHFIGNHNPELKRDFTWVQALGITFAGGRHRLYIGSRKAARWDEEVDHIVVALDGEPVDVAAVRDARWSSGTLPGLSVTRTDAVNSVLVQLDGVFAVSANAVPVTDEDDKVHKYGRTDRDSLVHLDLGFRFHNLTADVDGVLGQTYSPSYVSRLDIGAKMPVMGGAHKYLSSSLFSTDCAVSKFQHGVTAFAS